MLAGQNISFSREKFPLFADFSFSLKEGEHLVVKGPNGSGKSTFLRLLAGLIPVQKGSLFWKNKPISKLHLKLYQQNLFYCGHKLGVLPQARIRDQIQIWHHLYQVPFEVIEQALGVWGVGSFSHKRIFHLSQGQQKRLSLSRCHWLKRPLWILDEPDAGLDQAGQKLLKNSLIHHLENGGMIVQATHNSENHASHRNS